MAEHKHAAVLRAIADKGFEAAQYLAREANRDVWIQSSYACNPLTHPHFEWRIKPEPKPDVVRYVNVYGVTGIGELCKSDIEASANRRHTSGPSGMLRLTLSDNEGEYKLKSAEVLP